MALLLISSTRVRNLRILRKYNLNDCSVVTTMSDTSDDKKSMTARNKSLHTHVEIAPKSAAVFALNAFNHPVIVKKQNAHLSRILISPNVRKSRHCHPRNPKKRRFVAKNALIWGEADFTKAATP